ncbi:MAG: ribosome maturation factor RimP [Clostridia bacterium]|nr:ribosome maturation factor RimP [Clostridia bacterium]
MKIKELDKLQTFLQEIATPLNIEVIEVEFKQGKNPELTIYIDKDGGVDLDTCELFHNAIFDPIDEFDLTYGQSYTLNVSSPGVDRPFKTEKDYLSHIGKMVEIKLYSSIKGKKFLEGTLLSYDGERVVVKIDEKTTLSIELKNIVKMNEYIAFD